MSSKPPSAIGIGGGAMAIVTDQANISLWPRNIRAQMDVMIEGDGSRIAPRAAQRRKFRMSPIEVEDRSLKAHAARGGCQVGMATDAVAVRCVGELQSSAMLHMAGAAKRSENLIGLMPGSS